MTVRPRVRRAAPGAAALLLPLLLAAFLPASALAAGQFGVGVFGTWNSYAMDDLNEEVVGAANDSLAFLGAAARLDDVDGGIGFGGGLRYRSGSNLLFALDYERLTGGTDASEGGVTFEIDVPANAVTGTVTYLLASESAIRFGFGGGLGYYSSAATSSVRDPSTSLELDVEGSGIGYHAGGALDAALSDQVRLSVFAGWRQAKTSDLEVGGVKLVTSGGDDATLDWSGFMVKIGVDFYFGTTGAE